MRNLLPHFIAERYTQKIDGGTFRGAVMIIDISGFTSLTEQLMDAGDEGAEVLSIILGRIFTPVIDAVYRRDGFVSGFAGDALTSIFACHEENPSGCRLQAIHSAERVREIFVKKGVQRTRLGEFRLESRVGISIGEIEWGITGGNDKAFFFRGDGIERCVRSLNMSTPGTVVLDGDTRKGLGADLDCEEIEKGYFRILDVMHLESDERTSHRFTLNRNIGKRFLPEPVTALSHKGEFRNVVSIFVSFAPERSTGEFEIFARILIDTITLYSGYLNKIDFGDKGGIALCLFGAPLAFEDNVRRALDFALALKDRLNKVKSAGTTALWENLAVKAGLAYGPVYAGIIGSRKRGEYTVLGGIVNLSARLMEKANKGEILVTEQICRYASCQYTFASIGEFDLRGTKGHTPVYMLESEKSVVSRTFSGRFIGRGEELARLSELLLPLKRVTFGGIVYVFGEPGIGKTRLLWEFKRKNPEIYWCHLPCEGILRKPLNPFTHFFSQFFSQSAGLSARGNKENFERRYRELMHDLHALSGSNAPGEGEVTGTIAKELRRLKSVMGGFLGIRYRDSLYDRLDMKLRHENTLYAFKALFRALSMLRPVVMDLEDIQWIDPDTVSALQILMTNIDAHAILLVASGRYRDDMTKPLLPMETTSHEINLDHLSKSGVREFSQDFLGGDISATLLEHLISKGRGNPFFTEQMLHYFKESGFTGMRDGVWEIIGGESAIPSSLNDLLIARIDRLSVTLKNTVQTAAVVGREFEIRLLSELLRDRDITPDMKEGLSLNIWSLLSELKYIFSHALLREAAYRMQLKTRIRRLHRLAARAVERFYSGDGRYFADLAFHYEMAEIKSKTLEYLEKAGDVARENYENEIALEYYRKLVAMLEGTRKNRFRIVDSLLKESDILLLVGKTEEARCVSRDALSLSERIGDRRRLARACMAIGKILWVMTRYEEALRYSTRAAKLFEGLADACGHSEVLGNIGLVYHDLDEYETALDYFDRELETGKKVGDEGCIARAFHHMGNVHSHRADYKNAVLCYDRSLTINRKLNDRLMIGIIEGNKGVIYGKKGDFRKAAACFRKKMKICEELGDRRNYSIACGNMGILHSIQNNYDAAMRYYRKGLRTSEEMGSKGDIATSIGNIAALLATKGENERAIEYLQQQISLGEQTGEKRPIMIALANMGVAYSRMGDTDRAIRCHEKSLALAREIGRRREELINLGNLGTIHAERGEFDCAIDCYRQKIAFFEALGEKKGLSTTMGALGDLYAEQRESEKALRAYERAISISRELKMKNELFDQLISMGELLLSLERHDESRACGEEGMELAGKPEISDFAFKAKVLMARIDFTTGEKKDATCRLETMLAETENDEERAILHYELWKMAGMMKGLQGKSEVHRHDALIIYGKLAEISQKHLYRKRLAELSE